MSGGCFDYKNDYLCDEIFGYDLSPEYNLEKIKKLSRSAARKNPLEDRVISEIVFDIFCLLHSFDWYTSGDTSESTYFEDIEYFKEKWLECDNKTLSKRIADEAIEDCKAELYKALGIQYDSYDDDCDTGFCSCDDCDVGFCSRDDYESGRAECLDEEGEEIYRITPKGVTAVAMIESGIINDAEDPMLDEFYSLFEKYMRKAGYVHDPEDE